MGYTHYYYQTRSFADLEWSKIVIAVNSILQTAAKERNIVVCGGLGKDSPVVNVNEIWLNGDESQDLDHETFMLNRKKPANPAYRAHEKDYFSFCKTARKPYDVVVTSVLAAAKEIAPDALELSSDGGPAVFEPARVIWPA